MFDCVVCLLLYLLFLLLLLLRSSVACGCLYEGISKGGEEWKSFVTKFYSAIMIDLSYFLDTGR